jgi:hypothetical protein
LCSTSFSVSHVEIVEIVDFVIHELSMSISNVSIFFPDSHGHTPRESAFRLVSGLLSTCEILQYDIFETYGVSLRIFTAGQLLVLQVSDKSIAANYGL